MSDEESGVFISMPLPDERIFRYEAADDILGLLFRNAHREFSNTELREVTNHGGKSVHNALEILEGLDLVERRTEDKRSVVKINHERLQKPDDPLFRIPQAEFREPIRAFLDRVLDERGREVVGVVVFGSVPRGDADRTSDIDVQVIVEDDVVEMRREIQSIRQELENERFDGNRYEFQVLVESVDSATNYGEKLREMFSEGIVLYGTDELGEVKEAVFSGE